jgi:hypothetical protein
VVSGADDRSWVMGNEGEGDRFSACVRARRG